MIIVSFYTELYEEQHHVLRNSLERLGLRYDIQKVPSRGTWKTNCLYRGQFIVDMMDKHNDDVVWLDADAEVLKHPSDLFSINPNTDLAWYDRGGHEIMLGTSYYKNTSLVRYLLLEWAATSDVDSPNISQRDFMQLFKTKYEKKMRVQILPESYCHIFDKESPLFEPAVIVHNQLSRKTRHFTVKTPTPPFQNSASFFTENIEAPKQVRTAAIITEPKHEIITEPEQKTDDRPTIILPLAQTNWAFDIRCTNLVRHLSSFYDIKKVSYVESKSVDADLVYWPTYESLDQMSRYHKKNCATIGGLVVRSLDESVKHFESLSKAIAVPNLTWFNQYLQKDLSTRLFLIPNGVDIDLFKPATRKGSTFTVGWAGNDLPRRAEVKRFEVLKEACRKLNIRLIGQGRSKCISHSHMPAFYHKIDLYVNLSTTEGSNNCILEAGACRVPVLGTPVGNMPELSKKGAVLLQQDLSDLEEKLQLLKSMHPIDRAALGESLYKEVTTNYSSYAMAMKYKQMFDYCLSL